MDNLIDIYSDVKVRVISVIILIFVAGIMMNFLGKVQSKNEKFDVYSAELTTAENATFILGCGMLNETDYYVMYKLREDGGKELFKVKASEVVLYDVLEDNEQPYYEIVKTSPISQTVKKLYIPKNSLRQSYDLSLNEK